MNKIDIIYMPPEQLKPLPRNARTHSAKQIDQIGASIARFGFNQPIIITDDNVVAAGNGRLAAALKMKLSEVPCIRLSSLVGADLRAFALADNKIAANSNFDWEIVAQELVELEQVGFDLTLIGFEPVEVDRIVLQADDASPAPKPGSPDHVPEVTATQEIVTREGDLWRLGRHRLLCGDARDIQGIARLMDGSQAAMAFTDAPYNRKASDLSHRGTVKHAAFCMASGEMSHAEFTEFLREGMVAMKGVCRDGAIAFTCMDWRHMREMETAGGDAGATLMNLCVWNKTNAGQGAFYRSQHELVYVWKFGGAPHVNNFKLGETGRFRSNVWTYAGSNTFKEGRLEELRSHPTPKPVAMIADAVLDVSRRGDVILDSYAGSGSTLIAAQKTGRIAHLVEYEPAYCDLVIRRFQAFTGKLAVHADTGKTFDEINAIRGKKGWISK